MREKKENNKEREERGIREMNIYPRFKFHLFI